MFTDEFKKRFMDKVEIIPFHECWIWTADPGSRGYGQIKFRGKTRRASRISYEMYKGEIPAGLVVMHSCDNPGCVRPEHLSLGTIADNVADRERKGRGAKGSRLRRGKLKESDIPLIKELRYQGITYKEIASKFGVCLSNIHSVCVGKTWRPS